MIDGVQVFSATMFRDREVLGDRATEWIQANPDKGIVEHRVTQSSDQEFHCLTITFFWRFKPKSVKK